MVAAGAGRRALRGPSKPRRLLATSPFGAGAGGAARLQSELHAPQEEEEEEEAGRAGLHPGGFAFADQADPVHALDVALRPGGGVDPAGRAGLGWCGPVASCLRPARPSPPRCPAEGRFQPRGALAPPLRAAPAREPSRPPGRPPARSAEAAPAPAAARRRSRTMLDAAASVVTLEDITVYFSPEEWEELEAWQRQLHQDVMQENYALITSLAGCDIRVKEEEEEEDGACHGEEDIQALFLETFLLQGLKAEGENVPQEPRRPNGTLAELDVGWARLVQPRAAGGAPVAEACPLTCPDCGKRFKSKAARLTHQRIHTGERPFACAECGRSFTQRQHLGTHLRVHGGERPFACGECGCTFRLQKLLLTHRRKAHSGEPPLACGDCGKPFNHKHHLMTHRRVHTGERPFPCPDCGKSFTQKHHLQTHRRGHSGDRPFPCPECGKTFKDRAGVLMHQIVHTGAKPFACQRCSKIFSHKHHLVIHQRVHTGEKPFSCEVCRKRFTQKHHLLSHARIHTGERPYRCEACPRSFKDRVTLKLHVRIHTGEKPFSCARCGERFRLRKALLSHHRTHDAPTELICTECGESFPRMRSLAAHRRRAHPSAPKETAAQPGSACKLLGLPAAGESAHSGQCEDGEVGRQPPPLECGGASQPDSGCGGLAPDFYAPPAAEMPAP